jgi:hypothetical protein
MSWEKCDRSPDSDWTRVRGRKHEQYTESLNSPRPKKARQVKNKVKSIAHHFFDIKGIVHKEVVQASQTVNFAY